MKKFSSEKIEKFLQGFLYTFLFLLPWQTILIIQKWEMGTIGIFGFEIILWILGIVFFIWYFQKKKPLGENRPLGRPAVGLENFEWLTMASCLFLGFCFLSTFWSAQRTVAFFQAIRLTEAFLLIWILLTLPFNRAKAIAWFIAGATLQAMLGIYQFLTQSTWSFKWLGLVSHPLTQTGTSVIQSEQAGRWLRAYGAFPHPNVFGGYLVLSIICTTIFIVQKKKNIFFYWVSLLLQCTSLFFTWSRSAWISALVWFVGLFIYWCFKKYKKIKIQKNIPQLCLITLILFSILTVFYFPLVKTRIQGESYHEVRSIEERIAGPKFAYELWKTAPLQGVGVGNYVPAIFEFVPTQDRWVYEPVHIVPLLMLTELGVIGLLLGAVLVIVYLKKINWNFFTALGLTAVLPLLLLDHYLYSLPVGLFLFALTLGITPQLLHTLSPPPGEK